MFWHGFFKIFEFYLYYEGTSWKEGSLVAGEVQEEEDEESSLMNRVG